MCLFESLNLFFLMDHALLIFCCLPSQRRVGELALTSDANRGRLVALGGPELLTRSVLILTAWEVLQRRGALRCEWIFCTWYCGKQDSGASWRWCFARRCFYRTFQHCSIGGGQKCGHEGMFTVLNCRWWCVTLKNCISGNDHSMADSSVHGSSDKSIYVLSTCSTRYADKLPRFGTGQHVYTTAVDACDLKSCFKFTAVVLRILACCMQLWRLPDSFLESARDQLTHAQPSRANMLQCLAPWRHAHIRYWRCACMSSVRCRGCTCQPSGIAIWRYRSGGSLRSASKFGVWSWRAVGVLACVCICIHACVHTRTCAYAWMCAYTYVCICLYVCTHACLRMCVCVCVNIHVHIQTCLFTCLHHAFCLQTCIHVWLRVCVCMRMCACVWVGRCIFM